jgi:hypothetical protein
MDTITCVNTLAQVTPLMGTVTCKAAYYRGRIVKVNRRRLVVSYFTRTMQRNKVEKPIERSIPADGFTLDSVTLDVVTRDLTAFPTFSEMVNAQGGYRPTIREETALHILLANAYDKYQTNRGDSRRAHRGSRPAAKTAAEVAEAKAYNARLAGARPRRISDDEAYGVFCEMNDSERFGTW